MLTVCGAEYS